MSTRRLLQSRNLSGGSGKQRHIDLDDEKSTSLSNARKHRNSESESDDEEDETDEDQHDDIATPVSPSNKPVWTRQDQINKSLPTNRSSSSSNTTTNHKTPTTPLNKRNITSTTTLRLFDQNAYSTVPLNQQIAIINSTPNTILGAMHCRIDKNVGGLALVDSKPPPYHLSHSSLSSASEPHLHAIHPEDKYGITPLRKTLSLLPQRNDVTSYFLYSIFAIFTIICAINTGSALFHEYQIYNTAPWVKYNQYVLDTHTIKDHGLGYINSLLHTGPTLGFSLPYVAKKFMKRIFTQPDLSNFISAQTHRVVEEKMNKHNVHHFTPRHPQRSLTQRPSQQYYLTNRLADIDSRQMDISPFYQSVVKNYGVCTDRSTSQPTLNYKQDNNELLDRQFNHDAAALSPYTSSPSSSQHSHTSHVINHNNNNNNNIKQNTATTTTFHPAPLQKNANSAMDKVSNWFSSWFDNRKYNREERFEFDHLTFIYSTLHQFIHASLFATMAMIGVGVWKDLTALAVVKTFNAIYHHRHLNLHYLQPHNMVPEFSLLRRISRGLDRLPIIPQCLCRALLYGVSFMSCWALFSLLSLNPIIGFVMTSFTSMIWFRFCADPARYYESILVTYPSTDDSGAIFHHPSSSSHHRQQKSQKSQKSQQPNNDLISSSIHIDDHHDDHKEGSEVEETSRTTTTKSRIARSPSGKTKSANRNNLTGTPIATSSSTTSSTSLSPIHHLRGSWNNRYQLMGLGFVIFRHLLIISLCCAVLYSSAKAYGEFFSELSSAPALNTLSPIEYANYINTRLSPKFIGSQLFAAGKSFKDTLTTRLFSSQSANNIAVLKDKAQANANDLIHITKQTTQFTWDIITTFTTNLFFLAQHCLIVIFAPMFFLAQSTTGRYLIAREQYPQYLSHFCYMLLSLYLSLKILFTMRNNGYIGAQFLSPFGSGYQRHQQQQQRQLHHQPNQHNDVVDHSASHLSHEIGHLSYDDGALTTVSQLFLIVLLTAVIYATGGLIIPLSFFCVDEAIGLVRDVKRYQNRHHYNTRAHHIVM